MLGNLSVFLSAWTLGFTPLAMSSARALAVASRSSGLPTTTSTSPLFSASSA